MLREKKSLPNLKVMEYDIAGNVLRAWRGGDGKLVFVVDGTIDEFKPNVLLIIDEYGDRKWDDVLENDFGISPDSVRPRVDNKYQKLDIEYGGLDVYAKLIDAYENDTNDLDAAIDELIDFRDTVIRRAAKARLSAANDIIAAANDTISRTEGTIAELRKKHKDLRVRLGEQKNSVGRKPTKESASKILRTESQIDAVMEKLSRADKRIKNARHRIEIATEDANAARDLLARQRDNKNNKNGAVAIVKPNLVLPVTNRVPALQQSFNEPQESDMAKQNNETDNEKMIENDSDEVVSKFTTPKFESQPTDENMSDDTEEVKPLLDEDPEILDEEIAFKPVEFDDIKPRVVEEESTARPKPDSDAGMVRPLAFSNSDSDDDESQEEKYEERYQEREEIERSDDIPVINAIKSVDAPAPMDTDTTGQFSNSQYDNIATTQPVSPRPAPVGGGYSRPLSPITGTAAPRPVDAQTRNRSSVAYYMLLILLIVLSVFTLWLYQKKNGGTVPFLNAPADGIIEEAETKPVDTPMVDDTDTARDLPLPEPIVEPEIEPEIEPEPVVEPEPDVPVVIDKPIEVKYPNDNILQAAAPDARVIESEEDVIMRKTAYDVAREDKPIYAPTPRVTNVIAPDVIFDDDIISVPVAPANYTDDVYYEDEDVYYNGGFQYEQNVNQSGGFVSEPVYQQTEPTVQKHLSVHDGGQYSIGYTETTY